MQGKFPRTALLFASFLALSLSTSGVYAENSRIAAQSAAPEKQGILYKIFGIGKKKEPAVVLPQKAPEPVQSPKADVKPKKKSQPKKAEPARKAPAKKASTPKKKVPIPVKKVQTPKANIAPAAVAPEVVKPDQAQIKENVQKTVQGLEKIDTEKAAGAGQVVATTEFYPLGFSSSVWNDADEGFRFHAAAARRMMSEGRPDLALMEIASSKEKASTAEELAEADRLQATADILIGKEVTNVIVSGANYPNDWKAVEVARASIAGDKSSYSVLIAIDEISKWPDAVASLIIRNYAPIADKNSIDVLVALADKLNASGSLNPSVVFLIAGYKHKISGNWDSAKAEFEKASSSVLGGVAARAKMELLEAGISKKEFSSEEIAAAATDIVNVRTNDSVERKALRLLADNSQGEEKVGALRLLEKLTSSPIIKDQVSKELDMVLGVIAKTAKEEQERIKAEAEAEKKAKEEVLEENNVKPEEPTWLLEEDVPEKTTKPKGRLSVKAIQKSVSEAKDFIRSFEEEKAD